MGDKLSTEETKAKEEEDDKSNHLREADIGAISPSVPDPGSGVEALPVYSFGSSSPAAVEYPISGAEQVDLSGLPDDNIQQLGNFEQPFDFFDHHPYQNYPIFAGYNEYHTFMDAACHQHDHEEKLLVSMLSHPFDGLLFLSSRNRILATDRRRGR